MAYIVRPTQYSLALYIALYMARAEIRSGLNKTPLTPPAGDKTPEVSGLMGFTLIGDFSFSAVMSLPSLPATLTVTGTGTSS